MFQEKVQEKLSQCDVSSSNMHEVEDTIFTTIVGKEINGWVRGLGMREHQVATFGQLVHIRLFKWKGCSYLHT